MKRILVILFILIAILAGGAYFLFIKAITPTDVPSKVVAAEEVIATSGTIAIASVDMGFIRRIDDMFNTGVDLSPLPSSKSAESKSGSNLLEKLNKQGGNLISQTDYALATLTVNQEKPAYSIVLFGRFTPDRFKKIIRQNYLVDDSSNGYWIITQNAEQVKEPDPCAVPVKKLIPKQQALQIQSDRIVLSSPDLMPVLLKRFTNNARAGISLTKWREFRKDKAAAGAVISPKKAKKGATDLPSAMLYGAISNQPLKEIYAGTKVSMLPSPGFTFLIDAHSNKPAWPLEVKTKYDSWVAETLNELKDMPTLASVFQSLNVQADGSVLRFTSIADKTMLENLEKIPGELLKMAFSGVFDGGDLDGPASAEQIIKDSEIEKYMSQFDFSTIPPFDVKDIFYKPDYVAGPFGVRLKRIGLLATDDSVIELKINVEGKGFENLSGESMHKSDESPTTSLLITSVEDKDENDLLREELCGKSRNLAAESLTTLRDKEYVNNEWLSKSIKIFGDKSVRLKEGVPLAQVAIIKGKIIVRAATQTKVKTLQIPFAKKTIKNSKVRMYFKRSNLSTVKYDLSGDMSRILSVRAKNENGEYLANDNSSATSYDGIKRVSKRFKGKIASIEVVLAEEMKSADYPFVLNKIEPRYGKKGDGKEIEVKFTSKRRFLREHSKVKYKNQCKDKKQVRVGAFLVCMNKFGTHWGQEVGGEFDVVAPAEEALQNDISAATLSIDSVMTKNGEKISFNKKETVDFNYKFDTQYNDKKKEWQITNRRLHAFNIKISKDDEKLKDKIISIVKGTLTVRIPKVPKHIVLGSNELGVVKKTSDGITASIAGFEDWNTYIDLQGPVNKVMRLMPLAKNGTPLNTANDRINEKQYQMWGMSNKEKEKIKSLPKKWEGMITIYGKPEKIRIFYADNFDIIKGKFQFSLVEE